MAISKWPIAGVGQTLHNTNSGLMHINSNTIPLEMIVLHLRNVVGNIG